MKNKFIDLFDLMFVCIIVALIVLLYHQDRIIAEAQEAEPVIEYVEAEPITIIEYVTVEPDRAETMATELYARSLELDKIKAEGLITNKEWFLRYKDLLEEYSDYCEYPESIYDVYTDEEIYYMQRVIETEVYGGDFDSKVNVANVILNRIFNGAFGDDPISVVTAPGQFAVIRTTISEDTKLALEYAYEIEDTTDGALYFRSDIAPETWNGKTFKFKDKVGHAFY